MNKTILSAGLTAAAAALAMALVLPSSRLSPIPALLADSTSSNLSQYKAAQGLTAAMEQNLLVVSWSGPPGPGSDGVGDGQGTGTRPHVVPIARPPGVLTAKPDPQPEGWRAPQPLPGRDPQPDPPREPRPGADVIPDVLKPPGG